MEVLIVGTEENAKECREKFGENHVYRKTVINEVGRHLKPGVIVFDFEPTDLSVYDDKDLIVFLNSTTTTLASLTSGKKTNATVIGFCGLPAFLNREILEVTVLNEESKKALEATCSELNTKYKVVDDRVGMVTPRIIGMIINEAYFAIEGEVASREDIDLAMKLGTNYPFGPFEWGAKIGLKNVYELLRAVQAETQDDRYEICSKLEQDALA